MTVGAALVCILLCALCFSLGRSWERDYQEWLRLKPERSDENDGAC